MAVPTQQATWPGSKPGGFEMFGLCARQANLMRLKGHRFCIDGVTSGTLNVCRAEEKGDIVASSVNLNQKACVLRLFLKPT